MLSILRKKAFNGVHPQDMKSASCKIAIEHAAVKANDDFYVVLNQHVGAPAKPVVQKGQYVRSGELIAEASGAVSANIHSPVDGIITSVDGYVDYPAIGRAPCITIRAGESQGAPLLLPDASVIEMARLAGIVGMGGAMFPTHVKLSSPKPIETLIINGAECEPYLTCDHRLMLERGQDMVKGALLIKNALKLKKIIIGIEENKPDAIEFIRKTAGDIMEVCVLPAFYPQGGERQLILSATGKEVPEGKLPSELSVLVHNVATVLALHDAYYFRKPLTHRVVTVSGGVYAPKNILAPIGMPISRLLEMCGGLKIGYDKIVLGGPLTGFAVANTAVPVYKGLNGVIVMSAKYRHPVERPCIRCGACIGACPAGLSPVMLENLAKEKMYDELYRWKLLSCIECSACNYVCPSLRPLKNVFRLAKKEVSLLAKKG